MLLLVGASAPALYVGSGALFLCLVGLCPVAQEKLICMSECGSNDSSDDDVGGRASEWYEVGI